MFVKVDGNVFSVLNDAVVEWDDTHKCTAANLLPEERELFGIFEYNQVAPPVYDELTHGVREVLNNPIIIDNLVQQQWEVYPLPIEEVTANLQRKLEAERNKAKQERQQKVDNIKVTTSTGKTFDGDEVSQTRMARAIIALQATNTPSVTWVLADNTVTQATVEELVEAMALSGAEQASVWVL